MSMIRRLCRSLLEDSSAAPGHTHTQRLNVFKEKFKRHQDIYRGQQVFLPLCPQPLLVPFVEREYLNAVKQNVYSTWVCRVVGQGLAWAPGSALCCLGSPGAATGGRGCSRGPRSPCMHLRVGMASFGAWSWAGLAPHRLGQGPSKRDHASLGKGNVS